MSKMRQKFKNDPIVERSISQVSDIIINTCMKFENNPIKTFGEDALYSYYILYIPSFQNFKNSPKIQK